MNNYERIKAMTLDEMAEFLNNQYDVCELDKPCEDCKNAVWCSCDTFEDFKKWLEKENL